MSEPERLDVMVLMEDEDGIVTCEFLEDVLEEEATGFFWED